MLLGVQSAVHSRSRAELPRPSAWPWPAIPELVLLPASPVVWWCFQHAPCSSYSNKAHTYPYDVLGVHGYLLNSLSSLHQSHLSSLTQSIEAFSNPHLWFLRNQTISGFLSHHITPLFLHTFDKKASLMEMMSKPQHPCIKFWSWWITVMQKKRKKNAFKIILMKSLLHEMCLCEMLQLGTSIREGGNSGVWLSTLI